MQSTIRLEPLRFESGIGKVKGVGLGMTEDQLLALGYPVVSSSIIEEGDEYRVLYVTLEKDVVLEAIFSSKLLQRIIIRSPAVRDQFNSGLGTTLGELRNRYPAGKLFIGYEGAKHANFVSDTKAIFRLDMHSIAEDCYIDSMKSENCVSDNVQVESIVLDISAN